MQKDNVQNDAENLLKRQIEELIKEKQFVVTAIDGRCAAGKTTLASRLQEKLSCPVVHMDDFFLRPEQRTKERLQTPGGNVDYERFLEEVLVPLQSHRTFSYRPFDCHTQTLKEPVEIKADRLTIIEGSYACHPYLWEYADLHVFLDVEETVQMERIRLREGSRKAEIFAKKWIPMEELYFTECHIREKCEITCRSCKKATFYA